MQNSQAMLIVCEFFNEKFRSKTNIILDKYPMGVYFVIENKIPPWGILNGCNRYIVQKSYQERRNPMAEQIEEKPTCCHCHQKSTPRSEKEKKQLQNRLSRMAGQLSGISRMLEENRYCGDILTQVAAVESALQAFGYAILKEHMETCVVEEIQKGNTAIVEEAVELVKKLK